ncbi:MAG: PLP-dependent transferase [Candidatus Lloydbacteria bacterium]|nr:PLP-dependent transferase [Candidatus Lloydbacteria bacterium]
MGRRLHGGDGAVNETPWKSIAFAPPEGASQLRRFFSGDIRENEIPFFYHGVGRHTPENYALVKKILEGECGADKNEYDGITFASGMSAIWMFLLSVCAPGKAVIYSGKIYGCTFVACYELLPDLGIPTYRVDNPGDEKAWREAAEKAISDGHDVGCLFGETPSNPLTDCFLIRMLASIAREFNAVSAIDNTIMTHALQRPFLWGIDAVVISASKGLNGSSTDLGGILLAKKEIFEEMSSRKFFHTMRPVMSPSTAGCLLQHLPYLEVAMKRHSENARILSLYLMTEENFVEKVYYPSALYPCGGEILRDQMNGCGGPLLSFEINGGLEKAEAFVDALQHSATMVHICDHRYTLVNCSGATTHADMDEETQRAVGIKSNLIRVSPSAEDEKTFREYLIRDFRQAFEKVF